MSKPTVKNNMPILTFEPEITRRKLPSTYINENVFNQLVAYTKFVKIRFNREPSFTEVIEKALEYVFANDKRFNEWYSLQQKGTPSGKEREFSFSAQLSFFRETSTHLTFHLLYEET
jgi:hypothetical protein